MSLYNSLRNAYSIYGGEFAHLSLILKKYVYLATLGLSCGTQGRLYVVRNLSLQRQDSLVVAQGLSSCSLRA